MFLLWYGARTNTTVPGFFETPYFALTAIKIAITLVVITTSSPNHPDSYINIKNNSNNNDDDYSCYNNTKKNRANINGYD